MGISSKNKKNEKQNKNITKQIKLIKKKKEKWKWLQWVKACNLKIHSFQSPSPSLQLRDCPLFLILLIKN